MTRFSIVTIMALLLGVVALAWGAPGWVLAVAGVYLTLTGLGVAIPQWRWFGPFICRGNRSRRWIALTFDDGPDARSTPALLELLREAKVCAAFFCVGQRVAENRDLAARIVHDGHLVGNHSWAHSHATNFFSVARLRDELTRAQRIIQEATGVAPRWFRPPMGLSNPRVFRVARALGLSVVGWSARGFDTQITDPERVVRRILRQIRPGAIVLLHDGNVSAERLLLTVQLLLSKLSERDYEVARLDHLLK